MKQNQHRAEGEGSRRRTSQKAKVQSASTRPAHGETTGKPRKRLKRVRVLMPKELKAAVVAAARKMGISRAEFVRRAVECGIEAAEELAAKGKRGAR